MIALSRLAHMTHATASGSRSVSIREKLIVALDVSTEAGARAAIAELSGRVGAFKVGLQLFTAAGPAFVRNICAEGHRIFLDLKFHDIPNTVANAGVEAARLGVWMFNVHGLGGREMMRRVAVEVENACASENLMRPKIIAVTALTSSDANSLRETGIEQGVETHVERLAALAADCGLDGVVASPQESRIVRSRVEKDDFLIVTPGIRPSEATNDDQRRISKPAEALKAGSDFLVIGRPIMNALDRTAAVETIVAEIDNELR